MITMVGTGVLPLELALFIVLGANIGICVTALLASVVVGLERVADHLVNVGYSIVNPIGSQKEDI